MLQPIELKLDLPIKLSNNILSSTGKVWEMLVASKEGDLEKVKKLIEKCPALAFAQYNYTPPVHFAVREGHSEMLIYLLGLGAHDPSYRIYPFRDTSQTIADDRGYAAIVKQLDEYAADPARHRYKGDNGEIFYHRTGTDKEFEQAVDKSDVGKAEAILKEHPQLVKDQTFFWSEGILMMPTKKNDRAMVDMLFQYGASVPSLLKWAQFYYFEKKEMAAYLLEKGMDPNVQSWHHVTLLHDMAQKGNVDKAALLIKHGADINAIDEEYRSTPLGMAARWGHIEMVKYLLAQGADPTASGAEWSTPLAWAKKKGHKEIENILQRGFIE